MGGGAIRLPLKPAQIIEVPVEVPAADDWQPQPDWIDISNVADNEINLLVADINLYFSIIIDCVGGYTVNWGDGVVNNWGSAIESFHTYTVGTGQPCSQGYTTFKIKISSQTGNDITYFKVGTLPYNQQSNSLLYINFGTQNLTSLASSFINTRNTSDYLQAVYFPTSLNQCSSYRNVFDGLTSLEKVLMPSSYYSDIINMSSMLASATKIRNFDFNTTQSLNITILDLFGYNCYALEEIIFPPVINSCVSFGYLAYKCYALKELILPEINTNCDFSNCLMECWALNKVEFNASWNGKILNISNSINQLPALIEINLPTLNCNAGALTMGGNRIKRINLNGNNGTGLTSPVSLWGKNLEEINGLETIGLETVTILNGNTSFRNNYMLKVADFSTYGDTTSAVDHKYTWDGCYSLEVLRCRNKITGRFKLAGISGYTAKLNSLLFTNPAAVSTWAGASPQIDVAYCSMDATALNALFTSIIATSVSFSGKTIRITGNPGAATCDTSIITNAGGTVNLTT